SGKEIILTSSIGIAVYDGSQASPADVLREAEIAMYSAKRSGADRVEIFKPEMRNENDYRSTFEDDLRRAIERQQLRIYYQPIIDLEDEEVVGFETLVRWDHPNFGMITPEDFSRIAENTAYLKDLGAFVLNHATRQVARWHKTFPKRNKPLFVTVNITSGEVFRHDLVQDIRLILRRDAIPKGTLRLEVKESLVLENPEQSAEILEWLRGAGATLILDEFGTGFSSISYLSKFPFEAVKIDSSFVQQIGSSQNDYAVVRSMVSMLRELGKVVIAPGIETVEEAAFLRSIKCQYGQGYLYGDVMTEKEVMSLLSAIAKAGKKHETRQLSILRRSNKNGTQDSTTDPQKAEVKNDTPQFQSPEHRSGTNVGRPLLNLPNPTKAQSGAG
ncbi:MAG: putative bifunctional diguanylate cyclase/phosphodiesterase, partial [Desulfobulbia bacterium]